MTVFSAYMRIYCFGQFEALSLYICKLEVTERNGESYVLNNCRPDASLAMEGAIARARRGITRLSRGV